MAIRPYSFLYSPRARETFEPWRDKLGADFETVVTLLEDRDRQAEDYLSLGIGQGYLATASVTSNITGLTAPLADLAGLTVTVEVPANRRLIITAHTRLQNDGAGRGIGTLAINEGTTQLGVRITGYLEVGGAIGDAEDIDFCHFLAPTAGSHTYKLRAAQSSGSGKVVAFAENAAYITVEDIGPAA